jgi:F-type H+-transporting ATPase subunit b
VTGNLIKFKIMISFDPGLIIWTTIIFTLLLIVLKKFAWKPILSAVDERNKSIGEALKAADKAKEEMALLNADNERILAEARLQRDALLKEARDIKDGIINEAKEKANKEADKIITSAKEQIVNEKMKAITELKNSVAILSIDIAEKVIKRELKEKTNQEEFIAGVLKNSGLN